MVKRRSYSREFKLEAVRIWQDGDKTAAEVEDELGLRRHSLYEWKHHLLVKEEDSSEGKRRAEARIRQLERENWHLRQERDILKKAVAVFTRQSERDIN